MTRYYFTIATLLAFLTVECIGVYTLMNEGLPEFLLGYDPLVLVGIAGAVSALTAGVLVLASREGF